MKERQVPLTQAECDHLLTLLVCNEERGEYYGVERRYWERSDRLKEKLAWPVEGES